MKHVLTTLAIGFFAVGMTPQAAMAQDGAFSMGQLTGTLSTDHVTQGERARAQRTHRAPVASRSDTGTICANNRAMIRRGAAGSKVQRLRSLCVRAGY